MGWLLKAWGNGKTATHAATILGIAFGFMAERAGYQFNGQPVSAAEIGVAVAGLNMLAGIAAKFIRWVGGTGEFQ
jgi:hypothetical protein